MSDPAVTAANDRDVLSRMITGYQVSQAIYIAAKLEIADLLVDGPRTADDLASTVQAHAPSLYRLLRALSSIGIFRETEIGSFALTPMAEYLTSDIRDSSRIWAIMFNEVQYQAWGDMLTSIQTGEIAFDRLFGTSFFSYLADHPESNDTINQAMSTGSNRVGPALLEVYDFAPYETIVDIGGGNGLLLSTILAHYPDNRGILFEQPHVVADEATSRQLIDVAERCSAVAGDFFQDVPADGDIYILKQIIHDWDDERSERILRHCRRGITPSGRLLILDSVLAAANEPDPRKWMDLHMLALLGGRERTEAEFRALLERAGFDLLRVIPMPVGQCVIEAAPAKVGHDGT